jgi:hypothetical protein
MWQLLISTLYVILNGYLTNLCVEAEWQSYAIKKKGLRATDPTGEQRGTYFVSLPAKYGVPFQLVFAAMHFCLSQGMFLLLIETRDVFNGELLQQFPFIGSSPLGLITSEMRICPFLLRNRKLNYTPSGLHCAGIVHFAHGSQLPEDYALPTPRWYLQRRNKCSMSPTVGR